MVVQERCKIMKFLIIFVALIADCRCHELKHFEDTVLYKIDWPGEIGADFDQDKYESMIVTTSDQEKYRCLIPHVNNKEDDEQSKYTNLSPLNFLGPMFSATGCSYRIEAYWAYEICHGHHVKQYHEEREGKSIKVQEYYLGKWDDTKMEQLNEKVLEDLKSGKKYKQTKIDNAKYPYFEMEMTGGTMCDLNNEPRMTRVRYVCYPHGKNEIYSLKETSTCNYEAVILTSALCIHPAFLPEDSDESVINCLPIDDAPVKPLSWLVNKIDDMKMRYKHISDVFKSKENIENIAIIQVDTKDGTVRMELISNDLGERFINPGQTDQEDVTPATNLPKLLPAASSVKDTFPVNEFLKGNNCLTGGTGWWKYEFCYGKIIRQFHHDRDGKETLILGYFDEKLHKQWLKNNPEKRPSPKGIRTDISHLYQGGSFCEKTGEKRQTEVKLKCMMNVASPSTVSMYLLEPKTCQYILVVESPLICDILQVVDEDGLVPKSISGSDETNDGSDGDKTTDSRYVENLVVEVEEND